MHRATVAIMIGALALTGCGGSATSPSTPTTTPTTTPARPTPTPVPTPVGLTCTVPEYKDADGCTLMANASAKGHPMFLGELNQAIGTIKQEQPDLFEYDPAHPNQQPKIKHKSVYLASIVKVLARDYGLCARDNVSGLPRDEISIKNSNDWSEQYDVMTAEMYVFWGYTVTCKPTTF